MIILIDQDGVLADYEKGFLDDWRKQFPDEFYIPLDARTNFYPSDDYPEELREQIYSIYTAEGFILNLSPIEGAIEAVNELVELGHEVKICTSPLSKYENCVLEKYAWVERHFGRAFTKKVILSKDKTFIKGDILIDDKPSPDGLLIPEWEHVLFSQPYNRRVTGKRRMNWQNWQKILLAAS